MWPARAEDGLEKYVINDVDLDTRNEVPKIWLEDPDFDLVTWYRRLLGQQGIFERKYYDTHQELYKKSECRKFPTQLKIYLCHNPDYHLIITLII